MSELSIRWRLTLWYSTVLLAGLGAFGVAMSLALEHRLMAAVDRTLAQRVEGLRTTLDLEHNVPTLDQLRLELTEFAHEIAEGDRMRLEQGDGTVLLAPAEASPALDVPGVQTVYRQRAYRVMRSEFDYAGQHYRATVSADLTPTFDLLAEFRRLLYGMIPALALLAGVGGYWISGRALRPVDEITRVARSISISNLSQRLEVPRTNDEIQRMSTAWNEVLERLDSAVTRIHQFTADASHELRTPVALIRATAELALRRERTPESYRESLAQITNEAERLSELTEDLLTLARADAGGSSKLEFSALDLNRVARSTAEKVLPLAAERGIEFHFAPSGEAAQARANGAALTRLVLILLDNAVKHTPPGGTIRLQVKPQEGGVELAVEDTGEGIAAEALPHVFERFYRADPARANGNGTGLGLSIAQAIAQAHGSEIQVASAPGKGSRFWVMIPR